LLGRRQDLRIVGGEQQAKFKLNRAGAVTAMTTINESCDRGNQVQASPYAAALGLSPHVLRRWCDRLEELSEQLGLAILLYPRDPQFN
jgi:hypothetical protein